MALIETIDASPTPLKIKGKVVLAPQKPAPTSRTAWVVAAGVGALVLWRWLFRRGTSSLSAMPSSERAWRKESVLEILRFNRGASDRRLSRDLNMPLAEVRTILADLLSKSLVARDGETYTYTGIQTDGLQDLYVRFPGSLSKAWKGPYADWRWDRILAFARIGSKYGGPREVWHVNQSGSSTRMRRYEQGQRTYPDRISEGERAAERYRMTGSAEFNRPRFGSRRRRRYA